MFSTISTFINQQNHSHLFPSAPPMWNYLNPLPPHFACPPLTPLLRPRWLYSPDSDPALIPGQISSIEWHQRHRCSRAPAACCCSTYTLNHSNHRNRVYGDDHASDTTYHNSSFITQLRWGLLQSRKYKKTVNQMIWFITFTSVVWAPSGSVYGRGLSAQRGTRADHPPCCPGRDWIKEVEESIRSSSAVCHASVSSHRHCLLALGILMDETFDQIKQKMLNMHFVPFLL